MLLLLNLTSACLLSEGAFSTDGYLELMALENKQTFPNRNSTRPTAKGALAEEKGGKDGQGEGARKKGEGWFLPHLGELGGRKEEERRVVAVLGENTLTSFAGKIFCAGLVCRPTSSVYEAIAPRKTEKDSFICPPHVGNICHFCGLAIANFRSWRVLHTQKRAALLERHGCKNRSTLALPHEVIRQRNSY